MVDGRANQSERQRWNDPEWMAIWLPREQLTAAVTEPVLDVLGLRPGERVLDIGSGGGPLSLRAAEVLGPDGLVVGADISVPMVEVARARAQERGLSRVAFTVADVQTDAIDGGPFDAAASQFGVMFFADPQEAFENVARHVVAEGRLAFACWRGPGANPWCLNPLLAEFVPPAAPTTTGPFAFADPELVARILRASGWDDVECRPVAASQVVTKEALVHGRQLAAVPAERQAEAREAVEARLSPFSRDDGTFEVPLAYQIVTARRH